jgi:hypothetical protein
MKKTNTQATQFKDYPASQIKAKLQECIDYEAKYGTNDVVTAVKKWCKSYEYRKKEWEWRQNVAASIKPNVNYTKPYYADYDGYRYTAS